DGGGSRRGPRCRRARRGAARRPRPGGRLPRGAGARPAPRARRGRPARPRRPAADGAGPGRPARRLHRHRGEGLPEAGGGRGDGRRHARR
ncbi:MAG: hypothetical protein AVDCRST_MAG35-10, partial [uncultured Quadrisphaera sp.]